MTLFEDFESIKKKDGPEGQQHGGLPDYDNPNAPLADRMRPRELEEFVGQEHIVGPGKILRRMIDEDNIFSMIFWGPPGCGKTTLARIIANRTKSRFISYSAVISGIKQIKEVMELAQFERASHEKKTILFIDEIHRFNKAQQDAFLPYVENGTIILIGATTENPSFEIISALLSRCKVFILNKLSSQEIAILLKRAVADREKGYGKLKIEIEEKTIEYITEYSDGDSRIAYNILELSVSGFIKAGKGIENLGDQVIKIDVPLVENIIQKKMLLYDKGGEEHYNLISAVHKSMRGSDPDAAAYWVVRMIEGGEDPLYILRRLVRFASEDVGLADPAAMGIVLAAKDSFEFIGPPEGYLAVVEAAIYLALAPKSNALYTAHNSIKSDIQKTLSLPVPFHIRNAPTKLMKEIGYSKGYQYPHNFEKALVDQSYLPDAIAGTKYYLPTERGFEKSLKERLEKIKEYRQKLKQKNPAAGEDKKGTSSGL